MNALDRVIFRTIAEQSLREHEVSLGKVVTEVEVLVQEYKYWLWSYDVMTASARFIIRVRRLLSKYGLTSVLYNVLLQSRLCDKQARQFMLGEFVELGDLL